MLVEVRGVSATGDYAPIVARGTVRILGVSAVPANPPRVSLTEMLSGMYDGHFVEVEGVVRSVTDLGKNVDLKIAMIDGSLSATTVREADVDYARLVDAKVRIHGNAAPVFNRRSQMTGARLLFPDLKRLKVEQAAIRDPFALPVLPVEQLLRYTPNIAFRRRVHVRGRVSLEWPGRSLCIQDATQGLCVQTVQATRLAYGELVDLVGFPAFAGLAPTLTDANFRSAGRGQPVAALSVTARQALSGDQDAKPVQIEGQVIGQDRAAKDPTMVLSSGGILFSVVLPAGSWEGPPPDWAEGSSVRATGICSVQVENTRNLQGGLSMPASFRILLRSRRDIVITKEPSWWNAGHLLPVIAVILAVTLVVLGWVAVLRHRVAEQTAVILEQNATLSGLSFQDGLTGIANRRRFDEILVAELTRASRSSNPVSLLLVDIDHFKMLNDEYGHQRGDECLMLVANALASASLRSTDLVARYGGEEFGVILPGSDQSGAVAIGERMRSAVHDLSILCAGSVCSDVLTISVGAATITPEPGADPAALIRMADTALYQSKLMGRNRTTSAQEPVVCSSISP
jgi:diguanylate cyclase (GGDEF)-like protein